MLEKSINYIFVMFIESLPFKVGDTIYILTEDRKNIIQKKIDSISAHFGDEKRGKDILVWFTSEINHRNRECLKAEKFNVQWFLDLETAEKALDKDIGDNQEVI